MSKSIIRKRSYQAKYFTENLGKGITMDMMLIPAGIFFMGSPETELYRLDRESPQHKVTVPSFCMGKYPVTQAQWKAIAEQTDLKDKEDLEIKPARFNKDYHRKGDRWQRPVEKVNWYEAKEFCARLSKKTYRRYRLPTEAEWEYACRAVKIDDSLASDLTLEQWNQNYHQPFNFGETIDTSLANYRGTDWELDNNVYSGNYGRGVKGEFRQQTTPVGHFKVANAFGLYDMHGNVWEWCEDDGHDRYQGKDRPDDGTAWLSNDSSEDVKYKVSRGGSWGVNPYSCRSVFRSFNYPREYYNVIGFRVVYEMGRT